jgi:hypothetical protein
MSLKISMAGNEQEKAAGNFDAGQTDLVAQRLCFMNSTKRLRSPT